MSVRDEHIPIRSFRAVFRIERRLFRLGPWRLPLPYGLPLAAVGRAAGAALAIVVAGRLPVIGAVLGVLPLPARLGLLPALLAFLLCRLRPDGRPLERALRARVRFLLEPRRLAAFRPVPRPGVPVLLSDLVLVPDAQGAALRRAVLRVPRRAARPVELTLRYPAAVWGGGRTLHLQQAGATPLGRAVLATIRPGQRVVLEGARPE